jgi:hypothetical protein
LAHAQHAEKAILVVAQMHQGVLSAIPNMNKTKALRNKQGKK